MLGVLLSVSTGLEPWNELQPSNRSDRLDAVDRSTEMAPFRDRIALFPHFHAWSGYISIRGGACGATTPVGDDRSFRT